MAVTNQYSAAAFYNVVYRCVGRQRVRKREKSTEVRQQSAVHFVVASVLICFILYGAYPCLSLFIIFLGRASYWTSLILCSYV